MNERAHRSSARLRPNVPVALFGAASLVALLAASCTASEKDAFVLGNDLADSAAPGFSTVEDAGNDGSVTLTDYCPTDKCPPGWTTCPNSRFPCDVNLLADVKNCGACGLSCPTDTGNEIFACVEGTCALTCRGSSRMLDCDGIVDNGCEASSFHDEHCGACGNKCSNPSKRCVDQSGRNGDGIYGCGCPANKIYCDRGCWDPISDDDYCGDCETHCDPTNGGAPAIPHAYYGCVNSHCGNVKCEPYYANCDNQEANGCEQFLVEDDNCGACGNACGDGQVCRLDENNVARCMCPPDKTFCDAGCYDGFCFGRCVDLTSDNYNCGACGVDCYVPERNAKGVCNYGACVMDCNEGRADCNNAWSDGCEVNTDSDPQNCGACGHVCDAVAGQACVAGRCVVEPCSKDAGGGPTR